MNRPGMGSTKAFLKRSNAEAIACRLAVMNPGWTITAQPSPHELGCWGVRAERVFSDINENGSAKPVEGLRPLELMEMNPLPLDGSTGRLKVVWLKPNGDLKLC